jgi:Fe-S-cluster-containing hydrogenase component 2
VDLAATAIDYSPINSLHQGTWFKLICGASYGHLPAIQNLTIAYTLAGADCIDVAANPATIAAVRSGIEAARPFLAAARERGYPAQANPWVMVSLNDGEDPHFRKAHFDPEQCPAACIRPCEGVCPADAIPHRAAIVSDRCYGCGRCVPICPYGRIETLDFTVKPNAIVPHLMAGEIDAIEIHTTSGHLRSFERLWEELAPKADKLKLLSISCPDGEGLVNYLRSIYRTLSRPQLPGFQILWQTDGRPMSGDIGAGTTHAAIKLGTKILSAQLPGRVQLAGGTNSYTVPKLRERNLLPAPDRHHYISGVAYGSYARVLLAPILDQIETLPDTRGKLVAHPDLLWDAVAAAYQLVGQLKGN